VTTYIGWKNTEMLDDLLAMESGLTQWEVDFIEDLAIRRKECKEDEVHWTLSPKQRDMLIKICEDRL
jgi:hypothetical protein